MDTFWTKFAEFWEVWGPFIGTALIPTIITGLSISAKTVEAKNWVEKVWNLFKQAMDFLSVATPKDKAGTFQLPFKAGVLLKKKEDVPPVLILILALSLPMHQSGCSWFKSAGKEAKTTAIDCSVDAVKDNARALVPAILGILTGGSFNWKEQVQVFVKEFGRDATACALQAALQRLNDPVASEPVEDPETVRAESTKRADELVIEQGWVYSN